MACNQNPKVTPTYNEKGQVEPVYDAGAANTQLSVNPTNVTTPNYNTHGDRNPNFADVGSDVQVQYNEAGIRTPAYSTDGTPVSPTFSPIGQKSINFNPMSPGAITDYDEDAQHVPTYTDAGGLVREDILITGFDDGETLNDLFTGHGHLTIVDQRQNGGSAPKCLEGVFAYNPPIPANIPEYRFQFQINEKSDLHWKYKFGNDSFGGNVRFRLTVRELSQPEIVLTDFFWPPTTSYSTRSGILAIEENFGTWEARFQFDGTHSGSGVIQTGVTDDLEFYKTFIPQNYSECSG